MRDIREMREEREKGRREYIKKNIFLLVYIRKKPFISSLGGKKT